jgi:hypothetical protein
VLEPRTGRRPVVAGHALEGGAVLEEPGGAPAGERLDRSGIHGIFDIAAAPASLDPWRE